MTERIDGKLNYLERQLPEGLLVDAAWLKAHGYSTSLRRQYVTSGRLEHPARQVYRRPRGAFRWEQVVISLQALLQLPLVVGGRTALAVQGHVHYLTRETAEVHLYGPEAPPSWLRQLPLDVAFRYHNDKRLFHCGTVPQRLPGLDWTRTETGDAAKDLSKAHLTVLPWGQWDWPLTLSNPERATLELLDELPQRESFHQVDMLFDGLPNLSPRRLQTLLSDCRNVKVKRLFFFFADRHNHAWAKKLDRNNFDLGKGKRMLVRGGKLDPTYQITVPEDLDAVQ